MAPLEQLRAQLVLELLDLLAERRLADVEPLRGAPEMLLLGQVVNGVADRVRAEMFRRIGLDDLLSPRVEG